MSIELNVRDSFWGPLLNIRNRSRTLKSTLFLPLDIKKWLFYLRIRNASAGRSFYRWRFIRLPLKGARTWLRQHCVSFNASALYYQTLNTIFTESKLWLVCEFGLAIGNATICLLVTWLCIDDGLKHFSFRIMRWEGARLEVAGMKCTFY